jgi:hypothetical protein
MRDDSPPPASASRLKRAQKWLQKSLSRDAAEEEQTDNSRAKHEHVFVTPKLNLNGTRQEKIV